MEELQRLRTSRRGYRAHTTKLLTGMADLLKENAAVPIDNLTAASLALTVEQLQRKQTILEDLDAKIAPLIDNETDLEAEIMEAEDTKTKILDGIAHLKLKLSSCPLTESTEPQPVPRNLNSAPPSTASGPPHTQPQTTLSSTSTLHTVSATTSHNPHTSDDVHPTLETASHLQ